MRRFKKALCGTLTYGSLRLKAAGRSKKRTAGKNSVWVWTMTLIDSALHTV